MESQVLTPVVCSMKKGRVVIMTAGRHAGKKAVIVKQTDEGKKVSWRVQLIAFLCAGQEVRSRSRRGH